MEHTGTRTFGRLCAVALAVAVVLWASARAEAWPLLPVRPLPSSIAGPADPHPAAIFYNPAALGPLRGVRLWWDAGARLQLGTIRRDAGESAQAGQSTTIVNPSVDGFVGVTWDAFTDRVTFGIGVMSPFNELNRFPTGGATRYQAIWQRGATLEEVFAVGLRIASWVHIGVAANFGQSWIDYRFARDVAPAGGSAAIDQPSALCGGAPCGLENPLATQDVRVRGFGWGIGFSVGVLLRPVERVWLAVSYISHIFDPYRGIDLPLGTERGGAVRGAPGAPDPGCGGACVGRAQVNVLVPDILYFAVRVEATPRLEFEGFARWVHYGSRHVLDLYLQGGALDRIGAVDPQGAVPTQLRLDRRWRDAWAFGASLRVRLGPKLRLAPSIAYESSASDTAVLSAANLEADKLDLALALEWRPREHLTIGAHVGGTGYLVGHGGDAFDPRAEATCADARYALGACGKSLAGDALPAAAGRYTMGALHAGLALGMDY